MSEDLAPFTNGSIMSKQSSIASEQILDTENSSEEGQTDLHTFSSELVLSAKGYVDDGALLENLIHSVLGGFMLFRAVRNEQGSIVDFEWLAANESSKKITGREPSELIHKRLLVEMPGNREEGLFDEYVKVTETGEPFEREFYYQHELVDHWIQSRAVKCEDGFAVSFRDISEERRKQHLFHLVFETAPCALLLTDGTGRIELANVQACSLFGYSIHELTGMGIEELVPKESRPLHQQLRQRYLRSPQTQSMLEVRDVYGEHKSGRLLPVEVELHPVLFQDEELVLAAVIDISERKQTELKLNLLSNYDRLTGLPNRVLLHAKLHDLIIAANEQASTFAVLFLDLDNFKIVNDSLGHVFGDQLLVEAAQRISGCLEQEIACARISSDEFVLILRNPTAEAHVLEDAIAHLLRIFRQPFLVAHKEVHLTASIGVSQFPNDGATAEQLVQTADSAMALAKKKGGNRHSYFTAELTTAAQTKLDIQSGLRKALDHHEFELYYQPQIALVSGHCIGFEALLRWKHPEKGYIPPSTFIPVAEQSELIVELGTRVLEEACRQGRLWLDNGISFGKIAVNVAAQQMSDGSFHKLVERVLQETELPAHCLELEITESFAMQKAEASEAQLHALRELGVQIAMDDFGTGYSSLSYLTHLPIHKLKIDRSFVKDMVDDPKATTIVTTIIAMAKALKLEVLAEGIETMEQANLLLSQGCSKGQGYMYSKPVPARSIEDLIATDKLTFEPQSM